MPARTPPPGQLDIPLVWATDPADPVREPAPAGEAPPASSGGGASALRLWAGALADGVIAIVGAAGAAALAALLADAASPAALALAAVAGLEVVTVVAVGCLWGWRGTPGMLAAGVCFARPVPFGRACTLWALWLASLPLVGLPLAIRLRGESAAERLAGGALSSRSLPADA